MSSKKPKLKINPEFQSLCPKLTEEEQEHLCRSIAEEGCRDPIILWDAPNKKDHGTVLDGHNRIEICEAEGISFKTRFITLPNEGACRNWIIRNQLGRRNATEAQKDYLRGKWYREARLSEGRPSNESKLAQSEPVSTPATEGDPKLAQSEPVSTAERIAAETGVSASTVKRDAVFSEAVDALAEREPALKDAALRGEIPKSSVPALTKAPKAVLTKLAKLSGTELRKAVADFIAGNEPKEEDPLDNLICGFLHAANTDKIKLSQAQKLALAKFDEDTQKDMLKAILAGRTTVSRCIAEGCAPDPTIEEQIKAQAKEIEDACREIKEFVEEKVKSLTDKWVNHMGVRQLALDEFKKGCNTLRTAKCVAVCPKCEGKGCTACIRTGRVTSFVKSQLT